MIPFYSMTLIGSHQEDTCTYSEICVKETYLMGILLSNMNSPSPQAEWME